MSSKQMYNRVNAVFLGLLFVIIALLLVVYLPNLIGGSLEKYSDLNVLGVFSFIIVHAINDISYIIYFAATMLLSFAMQATYRNQSIVQYLKTGFGNLREKYLPVNYLAKQRTFIIFNVLATGLFIIFTFFNPVAWYYYLSLFLMIDFYLIGNYLGMYLFRSSQIQ